MLKLFSVRRDPDMRLSAPHGWSDQIWELLKEDFKKIEEQNTHLAQQIDQLEEQSTQLVEQSKQIRKKLDRAADQRRQLVEQNTQILNTLDDHIKQLKKMRAQDDGSLGQILELERQVHVLNERVGRQEE
jgi:ABC-type transporter Mla subunit MlaD